MIVTALKDILGTDRDVSGPGWNSRRLLLASDGMGFSLTDTIIKSGAMLELEYTNHLEACYCIEGKGQIKAPGDESWHSLEPFT
ncbi:MAG: ectoine synthase, partial [Pseudomonadota bacterium]